MGDGTTELIALITTTGTQFVFLYLYLRDRGKVEALQEARIADFKQWRELSTDRGLVSQTAPPHDTEPFMKISEGEKNEKSPK